MVVQNHAPKVDLGVLDRLYRKHIMVHKHYAFFQVLWHFIPFGFQILYDKFETRKLLGDRYAIAACPFAPPIYQIVSISDLEDNLSTVSALTSTIVPSPHSPQG
jgi:hypothetical protein